MTAPFAPDPAAGLRRDVLVSWAERTARCDRRVAGRSMLRFVFYGQVSTEDWQDPVTSRARQREQARALVRGHGHIVAELFDAGESRTVAWARRPQAAALVAQLADPDRGWDAVVIGEYERAFYGSQYAAMAPLLEHYGVQLWMPKAGGRVDCQSEHDEKTMTVLGRSSKREITRTSIRVRTRPDLDHDDITVFEGYGQQLLRPLTKLPLQTRTWGECPRQGRSGPSRPGWRFKPPKAGSAARKAALAEHSGGVSYAGPAAGCSA